MKGKVSLVLIGLMVLFLATVINGGCGETVYESSSYYYPNWMSDGRIICYKVTSKWSNALWGRKELGDTSYITAMDVDGNNEVDLFEVTTDGAKEITCSPTGEMIAYITNTASSSDVVITDYVGNVVKTPNVKANYLDWSPDATNITYSYGRNLFVVNVDGSNNTQIATSAEAVAWRVGEKIAYVKYMGTDYSKIAIINSDGTSEEVTSHIGGDLQKDEHDIYYRGRGDLNQESINAVRVVNLDGSGDTLKISNYERSSLKLSFDSTKIVGGDLITGGGSRIGGIWVTNISDGTSTEIR